MAQSTQLHSHTIVEVQSMVCDLLKDKVCQMESDAADASAADRHHRAELLMATAHELQFIQREVFLLLHEVWDESIEHQLRVTRPELPQVTPLSQTEVVS